MTRTALISGASGFIGSHLCRHLAQQGWSVHAMVRRDQIVPGAIAHVCDGSFDALRSMLNQVAPDTVFHLATCYVAEHRPEDLDRLVEANVSFGLRLLEAMRCTGTRRIVVAGTIWQHFHVVGDAYRPVNLYAATKQAFESLLSWHVDAGHVEALILRLPDTYGPGDPRRKIVQMLIESAHGGTHLALSPGEQVLDLLHVADAVSGLAACAEHIDRSPCRRVYRLGGERIRLRDLAALVAQCAGRAPNITWGGRPYREREVMDPWQGGIPLPSWKPTIPLHAGISMLSRESSS